MKTGFTDKIKDYILNSQVWKSLFRHGYPDNELNQSLVIFSNIILHTRPVKVRKKALDFRFAWCLGGLTFFFFILLALTGVFLMFYYIPDTRQAYYNLKDLNTVVFMGRVIRNLHKWSAEFMVFFICFHMIRVFLTGSYKRPRELNWVVGVILLSITFLLSWTGYLLPWDQLALWAVTVGTKMAEASPLVGNAGPFGKELGMTINNDIRFLLLGGTVVGQATLIRFYILHCMVLPIAGALLMVVHFWRIRKDGFSGPL